jgi:hypothetical protein
MGVPRVVVVVFFRVLRATGILSRGDRKEVSVLSDEYLSLVQQPKGNFSLLFFFFHC